MCRRLLILGVIDKEKEEGPKRSIHRPVDTLELWLVVLFYVSTDMRLLQRLVLSKCLVASGTRAASWDRRCFASTADVYTHFPAGTRTTPPAAAVPAA